MSILKQPFAPARLALPVLLALSAAACAENVSDGLAEAAPQTASAGAVQTVLTTTTRAQPQEAAQQWRWQTVATGLNHPWGLAFLPDGRFLISERSGDLRVVDAQGRISAPVTGLPKIDVGGQGGLLDVALDENFADNGRVYFCFSEPGSGGSSTALAEGVLSPEGSRLSQVKTLFSQAPKVRSNRHFGCPLRWRPDIFIWAWATEAAAAKRRKIWAATSAKSCAWAATAACPPIIRLCNKATHAAKFGATATAISKAWCWMRKAACGRASTAHKAAMKST